MLLGCCRTLSHYPGPNVSFFKTRIKCLMVGNDLLRNMSSAKENSCHMDDPVLREDALDIFQTAVDSVLPQSMVKKALKIEGNTLTVEDRQYNIHNNVHILGFGKAVAGMVRAAEDILGSHVQGGIVSISMGIQQEFKSMGKLDLLPAASSKVDLLEGAKNNLPDEAAHTTAMKIYEKACSLTEDDIALVLISGGGSALLPTPIPPITIEELQAVTRLVFSKGASITQVNTIRKQLELLKGGGLAQAADPAKVISLVLSDVIGDPLDFIASGPTCPDYSSPRECLDLFQTFNVYDEVPESVKKVLQERQTLYDDMRIKRLMKEQGEVLEDDIQRRRDCLNVQNVIVGSNKIAASAAEQQATRLGYVPYILSTSLQGEACSVGTLYGNLTSFLCHSMGNKAGRDSSKLMSDEMDLIKLGISKKSVNDLRSVADRALNTGKPICVIGSGETVVHVKGSGIGGRNQEMALSCAQCLHNDALKDNAFQQNFSVEFLSAGTDGHDGPCDATGALVNSRTISQASKQGLEVEQYLNNNDTYRFFMKLNGGRDHLITGLTGTNVMDVQLLMIKPMLW